MSFAIIQKIFPPNIAYRNFIFIPLFFVFYIALIFFDPALILLQHFTDRSVSYATNEGIDIGKRVSLFYKAIGFSFILLLLFTRITIIIRSYINKNELCLANGISLAGFCLLFFQLLGADMSSSIHFIIALLIMCFAGFVAHQIKKREPLDIIIPFLWSVLISILLFFLQWQIFYFVIGKSIFSLPNILVLAGIPIYLLFTGRFHLNYKILKVSQPLVFLPLLSFISIELFLILNQRGIFISPKIIYVFGIGLIFIRSLFLYIKFVPNHTSKPLLPLMFRNWMPWILAGIGCIAFYQPVIQPEIDWFEDANQVLPLHQWFSFGKIPFLDSFSPHGLSYFGFGLLYSIFNGADPMGGFVYHFIIKVVAVLIIYFFLYKISGNGFFATWIAVAYPYTDILFPFYFNLAPLAVIAFILLYENQTIKHYAFFFCSLLFMVFWRIDIGFSTFVAGIAGLLLLIFFVPTFKTDKKNLITGLGISFAILLLFFIVAFIRSGTNLLIYLKDTFEYLASIQSYGIRDLSINHDLKYFFLYFIFPAVVLLILLHCIYHITRQNDKNESTIVYRLSLIFLCLFYFSNLQRGLIRHTLVEQWDAALTSYSYLIIVSIIFISNTNKNSFLRFLGFFIVSTLLISNYVFTTPYLKKNNNYSLLTNRLTYPVSVPYSKEKVQRVLEDPSYRPNYSELNEFMKKNFSDSSTFIDFSNTPMLYYYTNRIIPNYFVQIPHTAHNEYLQKRFINELINYDVPATIYSNTPSNFWDNLDGIPNQLRHYRISEYIYRNYIPAYIINNHSVWLKKNLKIIDAEKEIFSVLTSDMIATGVSLKEGNEVRFESEPGFLDFRLNTPIPFDKNKIYMTVNVSSNLDGNLIVHYKSSDGNFNDKQKKIFKIHKGLNSIYVMVEPLENDKELNMIRFTIPYNSTLIFSPMKLFSSEYFKDHVSTIPTDYFLKWIPYMWGAYDKNFNSGKIEKLETIFSDRKLLPSNIESKFDFKTVSDKESGNYILVKARVITGRQTDITINYGDGEERNGSFSFSLKNDTLNHDYLIRISAQYNWYCKSNSWLSIYPKNNDIELTKMEILKGD